LIAEKILESKEIANFKSWVSFLFGLGAGKT